MNIETILKYADPVVAAAEAYLSVEKNPRCIEAAESSAAAHLMETLRDWNFVRREHLSKYPGIKHWSK